MTEVLDLGEIDGPLLVYGGPYSNFQATEALVAEAERLGIPRERRLCTGDVVAYCADPQSTVDLVRAEGGPVVMGNCEESLGDDLEDCGCGFEEGSACDLLSVQWYRHAQASLDRAAKDWMRGRPRRIAFTLGGKRFLAIHGGVSEISRFLFPSTPESDKAAELESAGRALGGVEAVICGHSGLPFTEVIGGRLWHNAGVIGMPANDGTPRVWYSLLTPGAGGVRIERRALAYDHCAAARAMRDAGLPEGYAAALETGLWPDDSIMPAADRAERGTALLPDEVAWPPGLRRSA